MSDVLNATIAEFYAKFGEPEYRYFKKRILWRRERGNPGGAHFTPIADGEEVSKAEYDANISETVRLRVAAFKGKLPQSYWSYDRKLVKDGWRERLIRTIAEAASPQDCTHTSAALTAEEMQVTQQSLDRLITTANLLFQSCESCAIHHHGLDFSDGMPGWLVDARADIDRVATAIRSLHREGASQWVS